MRAFTAATVLALALSAPLGGADAAGTERTARDFAYEDINPKSPTHGQRLSLRDLYADGGVVLNFLASWCGYCWKELPELEQMHVDKLAPVVGVAADEYGPPDDLLRLLGGTKATIPVLLVPRNEIKDMEQFWDHQMLPTTYVIDRQGKIRSVFQGRAPHEKLLDAIRTNLGS